MRGRNFYNKKYYIYLLILSNVKTFLSYYNIIYIYMSGFPKLTMRRDNLFSLKY